MNEMRKQLPLGHRLTPDQIAAVQSAARYMPDAVKQDEFYKDVADLLRPIR